MSWDYDFLLNNINKSIKAEIIYQKDFEELKMMLATIIDHDDFDTIGEINDSLLYRIYQHKIDKIAERLIKAEKCIEEETDAVKKSQYESAYARLCNEIAELGALQEGLRD